MNFPAESLPTARDRFDRMHKVLRNRICVLDYPPGTRLSEEDLAAEFGTSRTPLRRVLVRLEGEGLLQSVHGVGTFVTDVDIEALEQTYQLRMELAELLGVLGPNPPHPPQWVAGVPAPPAPPPHPPHPPAPGGVCKKYPPPYAPPGPPPPR